MAQVVRVGAHRVRAIAAVRQMRQEPDHRFDFGAAVIEHPDPTDDAALDLPDHSHTGLPRR